MWPYPRILAHRGGGKLAPENTLAALQCGLEYGFQAVEFDVMLSADGIPMLMHDPEFGRTVRGQGRVSDASAAQLMAMDAGAWHSPRYTGEPVPTYEQAALFCRQNRIWMNVEIKPVPGFEAQTGQAAAQWTRRLFADALLSPVAESGALPLFSSFSSVALEAAREAAPEFPRGLLVDTMPEDCRRRLEALEAVALHVNHKHLTRLQASAVKAAGYGLFCYTVNSIERASELLSWGVDAFCTDRIDLIGPDFR